MKTKETEVTGSVTVYAIPSGKKDAPFDYKIYDDTCDLSSEHRIKVHSTEIVIILPAGINLVEKAIETLEEKRAKAREEYYREDTRLQNEINKFLQLTHQPEPNSIEGTVVSEENDPQF